MMEYQKYLLPALEAAMTAGEAILEVYSKPDFKLELKSDASPVTEADFAAHRVISDLLGIHGIPLLSEEGKTIPVQERINWDSFWLVDPLDGTKEFIRKNGEFTVNIALIHKHKTIMGILYAPILDVMYFSSASSGAFRLESFSEKWTEIDSLDNLHTISEKLPLPKEDRPFRVVASRSHINNETKEYIGGLEKKHPGLEMVSRGSSLKFCLVAEGSADNYPRFGPTWEWDTGAGQAIAEAAGCTVTLLNEENPLTYNKEELLNPGFIVKRD